MCLGVAVAPRQHHRILHRIPIQIFLIRPPASIFRIVAGEIILRQFGSNRRGENRIRGNREFCRGLNRRPRRGIVDDRLQHRRHLVRCEISLTFYDLMPGSVEDDRGGPAKIFIACGKIGPRILIGLNDDVVGSQKLDHRRIAVGVRVHDVAPVTPYRLQVEQHETVLALRIGEHLVRPSLPVQRLFAGAVFLRGCPNRGRVRVRNDCQQ
jgi:hypothetical protein